jgi:transposase
MPPVPPAELALRARVADLEAENARLREVAAARDERAVAQLAARDAQLAARVEELERRLGKDSGTSSKPPSSDSPYKKKTRDRSQRGRSGRSPGKQPGAQSSTLKQSPDPGETAVCAPTACGCCGADLADAAVTGVQKRQVFEAPPPPPPTVIEYQVQAKECARCGAVTIGLAPAHVTGRAQYGLCVPRIPSTALISKVALLAVRPS